MCKLHIYNNGDKMWFLNGISHRANGPAMDWHNIVKWYWHGKKVTEYELMMLMGPEITNG